MSAIGRRRSRVRPGRSMIRLGGADLHVHTTHSDGGCSPGEVVRAAAAVGLSAVAITDHDTVSAVAVARPEADRLGIELIAGVELTADRDGRELHLLGHFIETDHPALAAACRELVDGRSRRVEAMVDRLNGLGLAVDLETLRRTFPRAILGRRHLADWLVRTGQVASHREVFARHLGDDAAAAIAKPRLAYRDAIALIRQAGGIAGLAHPPYDLRAETLRELAEAGLGALEVVGPGLDARVGARWRAWASALGLVPIAGSDFHTADRPGRWVGAITTPEADLGRLRLRALAARQVRAGAQGSPA